MEDVSSPGARATLTDAQRGDLRHRLAENFHILLFFREGYQPSDVDDELVEQIAALVEAKAYSHVVRAAELGMSRRQMVHTYAKEASTLLLTEVEKFCVPVEGPGGRAGSGNEVDLQQLSLNEISGGLRSIHTAPPHQQRLNTARDAAWGWLVPGSRMLPYVALKGAGVAIGRGKEALWAVCSANSMAGTGSPRSCLASGSDRHLAEVLKRNLGFVEVADGRVSRLHCIISMSAGVDGTPLPILEDCSSNGTFLNHRKLAKGESVPLVEGDRISLVLSVAPLVEQYFIFRAGDPRDPELAGSDEHSWVGSTHSTAGVFSPGAVHSNSPAPGTSIFRTATSRYTTAEQSTLEDLKCQICLNTLRQCVALEPCGHNFCATCLSHHLGSQLQSGLQLSCPFRCPPPERIIINYAVRALIELLGSSSRPLTGQHHTARAGSSAGAAAIRGRSVAGGRAPLQGAFGQAAGSSNSLSGMSPAPAGSQQQQHGDARHVGISDQQHQQRHHQQLLQPNHQQQQPSMLGSNHIGAAALGTSSSTFDAVAAAAAAAGGPGQPSGDSVSRSRFGSTASLRGAEAARTDVARTDSLDADYYTQSMSLLCPLDDEHLPMEAANLKSRQVEVALSQLKVSSLGVDDHLMCLEALARLAWSDDSVRELVANSGGVKSLVEVMDLHTGSDSIQCNGCLALMSLVRGEGEVCQSNQWHIAKAGAIEVIAKAMAAFRDNAMVQLSVLLCLIPLALENAMMQAHITQECLPDIMAALDHHREEVDIQTKGLVLLGVLIQGDDAVHDAIRIREMEVGVPARVVTALRLHGCSNDDVLWAALFVLAVLVRDSSAVFARATAALAWAGVLQVLQSSVDEYRRRHEAEHLEPDEMIVSAGDYLMRVLEPVQRHLQSRRMMLLAAAGLGALLGAGMLMTWLWSWESSSSSSSELGTAGSEDASARSSNSNVTASVNTPMTAPGAAAWVIAASASGQAVVRD